MLPHEGIVIQVRIGTIDAVNLIGLTMREILVRIETPPAREQSLPPQDFVDAGDAAAELVRGIEQRRVGIGDLRAQGQPRRALLGVDPFQHLHRPQSPNGPMPQQTADDRQRARAETERSYQIRDDVVVVSGV
jgi:hypothetical protein